jgi:hypothetical protein
VPGPAGLGAVGWVVCAAGWNCSGVCPVKEVKAKAVAPATTRALMTHASTSGRRPRRRGRFLPPGGGGGPVPAADGARSPESLVSELSAEAVRTWLSPVDAGSAELAAAVPVTAWSDPGAGAELAAAVPGLGADPGAGADSGTGAAQGAAASAAPDPANPGRDGTYAGPGLVFQANVLTIESGSQSPVGWRAPTSASMLSVVGRCAESLVRQRSMSGRTVAGT